MTSQQGDRARQTLPVWSRSAFDAAAAGIAVVACARPHRFLAVNPEFARLTGFEAAELADRPIHRVVLSNTADAATALEQVLAAGSPVDLDLDLIRSDGGTVPVEARFRPLPDDAQPAALVVTVADATVRREREAKLRQAWEESERAMRGKMRFFAAASHDLRQPLQALALFVSALGSHIRGEPAETILQAIKTSLRSMEDMFDSLLDMSRLDAGVLKAEPTTFFLGDVIEELEVEFRPQCRSHGLDLRVVPSSAQVVSDPRLLTRILRNFLSNAVRYTPSGRILLGARRRGDMLRIEVWDTGPGIPENQRLAIFDEFYRADAGTSGSGLGLAIVQRLARLLRHRLDVCCVEGRGTMFAVEVPVADAEGGAAAEGADGEDAAPDAASDLSGTVVAVVEDDPEVLGALVMILEEWGCRVAGASALDEVMGRLNSEGWRPDVILADLRLRHDRSGVTAIRTLLDFAGRDVPAFVFTGDTDTDSKLPYPVLRKPINPLKLRDVLAEALGLS